jgi:hypothetical protein
MPRADANVGKTYRANFASTTPCCRQSWARAMWGENVRPIDPPMKQAQADRNFLRRVESRAETLHQRSRK